MLRELDIRESVPSDTLAIEALYPDAFPEEDLLPLVRDLLPDSAVALSLVGTIDSQIAGHVIFTRCGITGITVNVALLGPLAVAPSWQKQGIGSALVRAGLRRLEDTDCAGVFVLGDPRYYSRLGFVREPRIEPPFSLPVEWIDAWQSLYLDDSLPTLGGRLTVPRQWREPSLWAA